MSKYLWPLSTRIDRLIAKIHYSMSLIANDCNNHSIDVAFEMFEQAYDLLPSMAVSSSKVDSKKVRGF